MSKKIKNNLIGAVVATIITVGTIGAVSAVQINNDSKSINTLNELSNGSKGADNELTIDDIVINVNDSNNSSDADINADSVIVYYRINSILFDEGDSIGKVTAKFNDEALDVKKIDNPNGGYPEVIWVSDIASKLLVGENTLVLSVTSMINGEETEPLKKTKIITGYGETDINNVVADTPKINSNDDYTVVLKGLVPNKPYEVVVTDPNDIDINESIKIPSDSSGVITIPIKLETPLFKEKNLVFKATTEGMLSPEHPIMVYNVKLVAGEIAVISNIEVTPPTSIDGADGIATMTIASGISSSPTYILKLGNEDPQIAVEYESGTVTIENLTAGDYTINVYSDDGETILDKGEFTIEAFIPMTENDEFSAGAIAGIVIGSLAVVGLIAGGGYYFYTTKK